LSGTSSKFGSMPLNISDFDPLEENFFAYNALPDGVSVSNDIDDVQGRRW